MILIIGLGNPGEEFKNTRHNIGREVCDSFRTNQDFPDFVFSKKFNAEISEGKTGKEKVVVVCPNTFMNKSGLATASLAKFYKIKPENILMVHDDSDLLLGSTKMSFGKHSAGHKGVESVIKSLKTLNFWRFRIGVSGKKHVEAEKIILKKFTPKEVLIIKKIIKKTVVAIEQTIKESPEKAMNEYNQ
ncbi:MAG: aminoacyl-tRNA hydrolase [bacterium]|nr:aminoacyl-tRNA hydrolase [bacterium]